jgi:MFS family permease
MRRLLSNPRLRILLVAEAVTNLGSWVTLMAIFSLLVFQGEGGVGDVSLVLLAGLGPMLLASPVAGALADRLDRKRLMVASQLLSALTITGLIFAPSLPAMLVLLALGAVAGSLMLPARQAAIPQLVAGEDLTQANAFFAQLNGVLKLLAPVLAGGLLAFLSPRQAMVVDVASFLAAALILTRLPALPPARRAAHESAPEEDSGADPGAGPGADSGTVSPPGSPAAAGKPLPAPAGGLGSALRSQPRLALLYPVAFLVVMAIMGFDIMSTVVTRDVLGGDEALFGLLVGLVGLGTLVGSLWLGLRGGRRDPWRDVLAGMVLLALLLVSVTAATLASRVDVARWILAAGCLAGGLGSGIGSVQIMTLLQRLAPPEVLGRAGGALQSALVGGQLVAMGLVPLVVPAYLSPGTYALLCAGLILAVVAGAAVALRRMAERPPEPQGAPEPDP